ncbi:MAG: hypothetical protein ACOC44_04895 [Promethearchaeia archaeon]
MLIRINVGSSYMLFEVSSINYDREKNLFGFAPPGAERASVISLDNPEWKESKEKTFPIDSISLFLGPRIYSLYPENMLPEVFYFEEEKKKKKKKDK